MICENRCDPEKCDFIHPFSWNIKLESICEMVQMKIQFANRFLFHWKIRFTAHDLFQFDIVCVCIWIVFNRERKGRIYWTIQRKIFEKQNYVCEFETTLVWPNIIKPVRSLCYAPITGTKYESNISNEAFLFAVVLPQTHSNK